jgi:mannose-6-phosphate isomerase-like protein (cupin superfamily)
MTACLLKKLYADCILEDSTILLVPVPIPFQEEKILAFGSNLHYDFNMRLIQTDLSMEKGWYTGPWDSELPISIGYARRNLIEYSDASSANLLNRAPTGVDEPHLHTRLTEIYLIGHGAAQIRIEQQTITLTAGDVLIVEPGEAHTFLSTSSDYLHFVIHTPGLAGEEARSEKKLVSREWLGL